MTDLKDELAPWAREIDERIRIEEQSGWTVLLSPGEAAHDLLETLRNRYPFEMLSDLTAVDYLNFPQPADDRFAMVYHLRSMSKGTRIRVKAFLPAENPEIPTMCDLWKDAEWLEREVYDLFGIRFTHHPDLRRILMPDDYPGHPLRKDYPLRGKGERMQFTSYH